MTPAQSHLLESITAAGIQKFSQNPTSSASSYPRNHSRRRSHSQGLGEYSQPAGLTVPESKEDGLPTQGPEFDTPPS